MCIPRTAVRSWTYPFTNELIWGIHHKTLRLGVSVELAGFHHQLLDFAAANEDLFERHVFALFFPPSDTTEVGCDCRLLYCCGRFYPPYIVVSFERFPFSDYMCIYARERMARYMKLWLLMKFISAFFFLIQVWVPSCTLLCDIYLCNLVYFSSRMPIHCMGLERST